MSMPSDEVGEAEVVVPGDAGETQAREGWSFVALIPHDGVEPPANFSDADARSVWAVVSALWHPILLAEASGLPTVESVDSPSPPAPRQVRLAAAGSFERLPSGYQTQAADAGTVLTAGETDRPETVEALLASFAAVDRGELANDDSVARDFLALGTACWVLRDLTTAMGHADGLDRENLTREVLAGARAWAGGDDNTAKNRLRAAFELLTQARERFYPVDAYAVDICLLDPAMPAGVLVGPLDARTPVTFLAPARAVEAQAAGDPAGVARLREAISEGWADVAGGAYSEVEEPLLPLGSILWQFRHGAAVYREHLDSRNVETLARRRFGLYPMLPQIGKRCGFRFAVHLGFDAGRFPVRPEAKKLWESPDHTNLESLTRPPLAADRATEGPRLAWRLALTMKDDHVATLPLVHWPSPVAGWFQDLRRVAAYSPVFARWVTLNDYFHLTDRPYETFAPEADDYASPYLAQAAARKDPRPVSGLAEHARLRARFDGLATLRAMAGALGTAPAAGDGPAADAVETLLETGKAGEAAAAVEAALPTWSAAVARGVVGSETGGRPGFLVINPAGVARRAAVLLPEAAADLRPEGPLRAAQFTDEGVWAVVELPAFGYAWVPRDTNFEASPAPAGTLVVRDRVLRNEAIAAEIDPTTGGIRGVKAAGEDTSRLGQQLVAVGPVGADGKPSPGRMVGETFEVEYAGPALAQAVTTGAVVGPDGRRLAAFRQRVRLWTGRPALELDVTLSDLNTDWLDGLADADPWSHYLACRWAWPDPNSMLRRTCLLAPELTESERPETPDALDISTRRQRTALLFAGLPYHRRHGSRMLDTLLVAGRETARAFRLGVALDLEHPFHASTELIAPTYVVPTEAGPPRTGPAGWLFLVDHKGVAVTGVEVVEPADEGRGWGLAFHMLETTGRAARARLRTFRNPTWARQTDFHNEVIVDLPIEGDAVLVDFTPHELARVEVTFG